jgi:hypothetical protein
MAGYQASTWPTDEVTEEFNFVDLVRMRPSSGTGARTS